MSAISYQINVGGNLQTVTAGTAAPTSGSVEIRFDQTTTSIHDASVAGGLRAVKKGEVFELIKVLTEYLIQDSNVAQ
jgi:hypothetical protein